MARVIKIVAGITVALIGVVAIGLATGLLNIFGGDCRMDSEIPEARRAVLDETGLAFVRAVLAPDPPAAYAMLALEAQDASPLSNVANQLQALHIGAGTFSDVRVAHTYLANQLGGGSAPTRAVCGSLAGQKWVAIAVKPNIEQAYVVIAAKTKNNDWAFTLWLVPDGSDWRVLNFHVGLSGVVGRTPEALLDLARQEREGGHAFNAAILLAAAQSASYRGPNFQLGIAPSLETESKALNLPAEVRGPPPFTWTMNGEVYQVGQASMIGVGDDVGITFVLPQTSWTSEADVQIKNRAFIDAFIATHPDYARVFNFLVARAMKPDNSGGYSTVYENQRGFVAD